MKIHCKTGLLLLVVLLCCSACSTTKRTTAREHPALQQQLQQIDKVVILPPVVSVDKVVFTGENENLKYLEERISEDLVVSTQNKLRNQGFEIVDFDFESGMAENNDLAFAIKQTRDGFSNAKKELYEKTAVPISDKGKICSSVGTAVNTISAACGADAIVLLQYSGFKKSAGMVTKDVLVGALVGALTGTYVQRPTEGAYVEIAVVDGTTGEVIWSDIHAAPKLEAKIIDKAMVSMPTDIDPPKTTNSQPVVAPNDETDAPAPELPVKTQAEAAPDSKGDANQK